MRRRHSAYIVATAPPTGREVTSATPGMPRTSSTPRHPRHDILDGRKRRKEPEHALVRHRRTRTRRSTTPAFVHPDAVIIGDVHHRPGVDGVARRGAAGRPRRDPGGRADVGPGRHRRPLHVHAGHRDRGPLHHRSSRPSGGLHDRGRLPDRVRLGRAAPGRRALRARWWGPRRWSRTTPRSRRRPWLWACRRRSSPTGWHPEPTDEAADIYVRNAHWYNATCAGWTDRGRPVAGPAAVRARSPRPARPGGRPGLRRARVRRDGHLRGVRAGPAGPATTAPASCAIRPPRPGPSPAGPARSGRPAGPRATQHRSTAAAPTRRMSRTRGKQLRHDLTLVRAAFRHVPESGADHGIGQVGHRRDRQPLPAVTGSTDQLPAPATPRYSSPSAGATTTPALGHPVRSRPRWTPPTTACP